MKKYIEKRLPTAFKVQITSMVDMFVIILVFLLKSYSTSPVNINLNNDLKLPVSSTQQDPVEVVKMVISKSGVFVEDKEILLFKAGTINTTDIDKSDPSFIPALFKELDDKAKQTQEISKLNDTVEFDGRVLVQADKDVPYALMQKIMYTSMLAGYPNIKFAVTSKD